ncbi:MAG: NAD-dependent epimerase/dehydratase family protein [Fimbriimonadaceae bacterium]|nr:NAD-dependent epimerase/dehydratase family protein [Fimbriimonadaceae bacterium]
MADKGRVLVLGGAGFIGGHLAESLVSAGYRVRVLDDLSSGRKENLAQVASDIEWIGGSILDRELMSQAVSGCKGVFHLAAAVSVQRSFLEPYDIHDVNATGTLNVVEACAEHGAKLIFSSTAAVYGEDVEQPVREGATLAPISPYGAQKLYGEGLIRSYVRAKGLSAVSLRYFNVYGPRQDPSSPYSGVISIFVRKVLVGKPLTIYGDGGQTRDFVNVRDIARANMLAFEGKSGDGESINIGTGDSVTLLELADTIFHVTGKRSEVLHEPGRQGDIRHSCSDPSLARERIGFTSSIRLEEGLSDLFNSIQR